MNYHRNHPIAAGLIGLYLLLVIVVGIYALTCETQWCSLVLVIPLTPWPQLESILGLDVPRFLLPLAVVLNVILLHFIGRALESVFISNK